MLLRKLTKLMRRLRWSRPLATGIPIHWHVGTPNFGDDLNPTLFQQIFGQSVRLERKRDLERVFGMGSILHKADRSCHVMGSGLLDPSFAVEDTVRSVVSVRGELSANSLSVTPHYLGDPAIFLPRFFQIAAPKKHRYGFVPHHCETRRVRSVIPRDWLLIDPSWPPIKVLHAIVSCEQVVCRSLHGLICADAYGVPSAWLEPLDEMMGGRFKYLDYYTTMNEAKQPISIQPRHLGKEGGALDFWVSNYRYDANAYLSRLQRFADAFR
ncbi:MAG: polysaccharide pyruvyl transferase family protein [Rubripirellula sp.]|nr:polysaccharide pyruvyl transferase family protein [Rubripirellula sp.]